MKEKDNLKNVTIGAIAVIITIGIGVLVVIPTVEASVLEYYQTKCNELGGTIETISHNASNMPPLYACKVNGYIVEIEPLEMIGMV